MTVDPQSLSVRQRAASARTQFFPAVSKKIRVAAWISFIFEVVIIGTGGAVRLTGSGLGCPTWPTCTAGSLIPTEELSYHSLIEFGNRLMTGVVGIAALVLFILVWKLRRERRDLFVLASIVLGGVVAQALVGGITVWTGLNPLVVGFHYVASLTLVCVSAAFLFLMRHEPGTRNPLASSRFSALAYLTAAFIALTIGVGVVTTASGPHSGDATAGRTGFNVELFEHLHAWPAYIAFALTVIMVAASYRYRTTVFGWSVTLLAVELVQIALGLYQARNGLPELAVGTHMVLASLLAAVMTVLLLAMRRSGSVSDASNSTPSTV